MSEKNKEKKLSGENHTVQKRGNDDKKKEGTACKVAKKCGGCQYQGVPYEKQLSEKQKAVRQLMQPFCKTAEITGMQDPYHYRNKVHAVFARKKDGTIISGVYEEGTHRVVPVETCQIEDEKADAIINVGVSGPGVVKVALEKARGENFEVLCETIKKTAFKITRVGQLVAQEASKRLGVPFGIIDLSLAPTPAVGDSVAEILEEIGLERVGAPGTTAALAMLNDQVKKGGVMASSYVGGLSGAFIPVSEDQGMIDAVSLGALTLEKLEAMTCVCSVGLDMIAIPGDTPDTTIAGMIADEAAIGMINQKTTAVRVIPVIGKTVGDTVEFGGLLGYAPVMPVNSYSCEKFVSRGGRIPAPIHSFKN